MDNELEIEGVKPVESQDVAVEDGSQGEALAPAVHEETVEELRERLAKAEAREREVRQESIKRRIDNKALHSERDELAERVEALEREARDAKLKAAQATALAKYELPEESLKILGDSPEEVEARAALLADLLKANKGKRNAALEEPRRSITAREPSGGRTPAVAAGDDDVKSLIARFS